ncbi:hypothetical protein GYMLUDRAFT_46325 [Collybiopsis luxurians FD-317 M1]|uniref:Uncharacterized protein n=1 Tax=Collybiopsis luxurians FD-317 M1 TaxID=944289 RepID=A0A0D0CPY5_9AGAR|nr:hypothetical protein GYMLUDRAFT_46325 [Collybiopsis luxurians FD-317 M1]
MSLEGLQGNRTLNILHKAEQGGYGILAQVWFVLRSCSFLPHAITLNPFLIGSISGGPN